MSKLTICNMKGDRVGEMTIAKDLLELKKGAQAVHDVVEAYRAGLRAGTASTKTKGEVEGGSAKPWKQKGTGRARAGSIRSPIWRGGGVVFGPSPRKNYEKKTTRKVAKLAFRRALSEKIAAGEVMVLDQLSVPEPKTKHVAAILRKLKAVRGALLVIQAPEKNVQLAARNLPHVEVSTASAVHTYQILRHPLILVSKDAMGTLEARLKNQAGSDS
jgi:large subunit ribosomal protein L4